MTGEALPPFDRRFFGSDALASRIGEGEIGGKARGLVRAAAIADSLAPGLGPSIELTVPRMVVIGTDTFDALLEDPALATLAYSDAPDDRIAHAFLRADLPVPILGDLRALVDTVRRPLAVRSSSRLEDRLAEPFAGVYVTKMIPNAEPERDLRFRRLCDAVRLVLASTFFREAKRYVAATGRSPGEEKMAVVVQEVVGRAHDVRFYPELSAVARSHNFYPFGRARREDGVVSLALGLGKRIVDGEVAWTYSPVEPEAPPPFADAGDRVRRTQSDFWAVNLGRPVSPAPARETEFLVRAGIRDADYDGTLRFLASTWDAANDRLVPGVAGPGPRVLDFAPLLKLRELPLNDALEALLERSRAEAGDDVELELAATFDGGAEPRAHLAFLQLRPLVVSADLVEVTDADLAGETVIVAACPVLGNGADSVRDVVYVRPGQFDRSRTRAIAREVEELNERLVAEGRPYALLGFGRWGTSDPWLGIPVEWSSIRGARAVVEATFEDVPVDPSQGSHFFHNVASFGVFYFYVRPDAGEKLDWRWLDSRPARAETAHLRHVRLERPLEIRVDGRTGRGVIRREGERT